MLAQLLCVAVMMAAKPVTLASPGLGSLNIEKEAATYYSDHFAQQLSVAGVRVYTSSEIATLLGFERQKQLAGCAEESTSCMTELANALGVDGIITGSLGKFGNAYQVNIKILASNDGRPLSVFSSRVAGEEQLLDEYTRAAKQMAGELNQQFGSEPATSVSSLRKWSWVPAAAGVALAVSGGVLLVRANDDLQHLIVHAPNETRDGAAIRNDGVKNQTAGFVCLSVGAAAIATGVAMFVIGGNTQTTVAISVGDGAFGVGIAGVLP